MAFILSAAAFFTSFAASTTASFASAALVLAFSTAGEGFFSLSLHAQTVKVAPNTNAPNNDFFIITNSLNKKFNTQGTSPYEVDYIQINVTF